MNRTTFASVAVSAVVAATLATPRHACAAAPVWWRASAVVPNDALPTPDSRGRLWMNVQRGALSYWDFAQSGVPNYQRPDDWHHLAGRPGFQIQARAVTTSDTVYAIARDLLAGEYTVLRRPLYGKTADWEEIPIAGKTALLMGMAADKSGTIWVGGERHEVFRWSGRGWLREVTPVPLHTVDIFPVADGTVWARAKGRGRSTMLRRIDGTWRVIADLPPGETAFCWADSNGCVVRCGDTLYRCRGAPGGEAVPWIRVPGAVSFAVDSDSTAWGFTPDSFYRIHGQVLEQLPQPPFVPSTAYMVSGHLLAIADPVCWIYGTPDVNQPLPRRPLGLQAGRLPKAPVGLGTYGLTVLQLHGKPCLYVARHTTVDCVVPLRDAATDWRALTARLGLQHLDENIQWTFRYETAALAADLNGDGTEDVLVTTMHDGCRLLRNVRDRRFVSWTEESGIGDRPEQIAQDAEFLDADADGDLDIHVCALQGRDRLYLNNGAAGFREALLESGMLPVEGSSCDLARDLDGDGDTDLVVSTLGRGLVVHENTGVKHGVPSFRSQVLFAGVPNPDVPQGLSIFHFTGIAAADFDGDGLSELIVPGQTQAPKFLWNRGGLRFEEDPAMISPGSSPGGANGATVFDADGDGDFDLAVTGTGGTCFYENTGRLELDPVSRDERGRAPTSMGSVVVDFDGDGDLDYIDAGELSEPTVYTNPGDGRQTLAVTVAGPPSNRSAVGASVSLFLASHEQQHPIAVQEVPGGSGYRSLGSKTLYFTHISPSQAYRVRARTPEGREAWADCVPGQHHVLVRLAKTGAAGVVETIAYRTKLVFLDRWQRLGLLLLALATIAVAGTAYGATRWTQRPFDWRAAAAVPVVGLLVKAVWPLDPKSGPVVYATLIGSMAGVGAMALLPRPQAAVGLASLGELALRLDVFQHNQAPRRALDQLMIVAANLSPTTIGGDKLEELLRQRLTAFARTALPELESILELASRAGVAHKHGKSAVGSSRRIADRLARGESLRSLEAISQFRALGASAGAALYWIRSMRRTVNRMLATPLAAVVERFANSRGADGGHVRYVCDVEPVIVRFPESDMLRILDILFDNSVRAANGHPVQIEIRSERTGARRIRLLVSDDGPGVPPQMRAQLFEHGAGLFSQGSGRGLYWAQRLLAPFGASISLLDSKGTGAHFAIEWDLLAPEDT